ncbi:hypothetical protein MASR1M66_04170 [Aminivibrio sp.]
MYKSPVGQPKLKFDPLPFEFTPDANNRWVRLASLIPWEELELLSDYRSHFGSTGNPALPFRVAFGALLVQTRLNLTDEETVEQIRENPYIQHFLGFEGYASVKKPFDPSMMVHFRKRLDAKTLKAIDLRIFERRRELEEAGKREISEVTEEDPSPDEMSGGSASPADGTPPASPPASPASSVLPSAGKKGPSEKHLSEETGEEELNGTLILDATCAPADITYPTDLKLLMATREGLEKLIDDIWKRVGKPGEMKPRTYRKNASRHGTGASKQRKLGGKKLRKTLKRQLSFVARNLRIIGTLLSSTTLGETLLSERQRKALTTAEEVHRQQKHMLDTKTHRADGRIVSFSQPHIRPIVRGKAGARVEFGAKLLVAIEEGHAFIVHSSWENFNESTLFVEACEQYYERNGCWPRIICADMIFRTCANHAWCNEKGIRLSGPRLGRPPKDEKKLAEIRRYEREDSGKRNEVEGKFGEGKRKYGLDLIRGKLPETSESMMALQFIIMNLWRMLRDSLSFFLESVEKVILGISWLFFIHKLRTSLATVETPDCLP